MFSSPRHHGPSSWSSKCRCTAPGFHHFFVGVTALLFSFRLTFRRSARGGGEKNAPPPPPPPPSPRTRLIGTANARACVCARVYARRCRRRRRSGRLTEEARGIAKIVAGRKKKEGRGTRSTCSVSFPRRYCPPDVEIVIRYSILVARRVRVVTEEISLRRGLRRKKEMGRRRRGGETR